MGRLKLSVCHNLHTALEVHSKLHHFNSIVKIYTDEHMIGQTSQCATIFQADWNHISKCNIHTTISDTMHSYSVMLPHTGLSIGHQIHQQA